MILTEEVILRQHQENRSLANILIIDDDADSVLLVQSVFAQLGCQTICSLNLSEAKKELLSQKADAIILDWFLDPRLNAGNIVDQCTRTLGKFEGARKPPKVVTCSSLEESEIILPESPFFEYLGHWQKPMTRSCILTKALNLLEILDRQKGEP